MAISTEIAATVSAKGNSAKNSLWTAFYVLVTGHFSSRGLPRPHRFQRLRNRKLRNYLFWRPFTCLKFFHCADGLSASVPASPQQKIALNDWFNCSLLTASDPDSFSASPHHAIASSVWSKRTCTYWTFSSWPGWPVHIAASVSAPGICANYLFWWRCFQSPFPAAMDAPGTAWSTTNV